MGNGEASASEMRALVVRLVEKQETERLWAARELHDVLGQSFTLLKLILDSARSTEAARMSGIIDEALAVVDEATEKVRRVSRGMRPGMLDLSLEQSLKWLFEVPAKNQGFDVVFTSRSLNDDLPQELNTAAYRIVQEALDNVARHAGVKTVKVTVAVKGRNLQLDIEDKGRGFDPMLVPAGKKCGLHFMKERASMVGGTLRVTSRPGGGTRLCAVFPLPEGKRAPPKPLC